MQTNIPQVNFHGQDWRSFEEWLLAELQTTYRRLADPTSTEETTQQNRGRAAFIMMLLDLRNSPAAKNRPGI